MRKGEIILFLQQTKRTDKRLLVRMKRHYSQPKGFVGRNICYAVYQDDIYYGHIVGGSATRFLPGRNEYLGITIKELNKVVNNIFYNISKVDNKYPKRNFTSLVVKEFMKTITKDWYKKYGDVVIGFETFVVETDYRKGCLYKADNWSFVGKTSGSRKHHKGLKNKSMRSKTNKKLIYCRWVKKEKIPIIKYISSWRKETKEEKERAKAITSAKDNLIGKVF